jgi:hypothetical protein
MISVGKSRADAVDRYCFPRDIPSQPRGAKLVPAAVSLFALEKQLASARGLVEPRQMGSAGPALGTLQVGPQSPSFRFRYWATRLKSLPAASSLSATHLSTSALRGPVVDTYS